MAPCTCAAASCWRCPLRRVFSATSASRCACKWGSAHECGVSALLDRSGCVMLLPPPPSPLPGTSVLLCAQALGRVAFSPRLPYLQEHLLSRAFTGSMIKCIILYPRSFWVRFWLVGRQVGQDLLVVTGHSAHTLRAAAWRFAGSVQPRGHALGMLPPPPPPLTHQSPLRRQQGSLGRSCAMPPVGPFST